MEYLKSGVPQTRGGKRKGAGRKKGSVNKHEPKIVESRPELPQRGGKKKKTWTDLRDYQIKKEPVTTTVSNDLFVSRCHRRTCRKKYTPTHKGQYLCSACSAAFEPS